MNRSQVVIFRAKLNCQHFLPFLKKSHGTFWHSGLQTYSNIISMLRSTKTNHKTLRKMELVYANLLAGMAMLSLIGNCGKEDTNKYGILSEENIKLYNKKIIGY